MKRCVIHLGLRVTKLRVFYIFASKGMLTPACSSFWGTLVVVPLKDTIKPLESTVLARIKPWNSLTPEPENSPNHFYRYRVLSSLKLTDWFFQFLPDEQSCAITTIETVVSWFSCADNGFREIFASARVCAFQRPILSWGQCAVPSSLDAYWQVDMTGD